MTPEFAITIGKQALEVTTIITAVVLLPALVVGLTVSMFQAATQINEATLSFIPKLLITFFTLAVAGSFILQMLMDYTIQLFTGIPVLLGLIE